MPSAAPDKPGGRRAAVAFCAALAVAACTGGAPSRDTAPAGELVLAGDGLRVGTTGLEIGFGRAEAGAVSAAVKLIGRQPTSRSTLRECRIAPIGAAHWDGGITMYFIDGAFVGWASSTPGTKTLRGVAVGDTAAELAARTGLAASAGAELTQDGITVLLAADGKVARLRAGTTCDGG